MRFLMPKVILEYKDTESGKNRLRSVHIKELNERTDIAVLTNKVLRKLFRDFGPEFIPKQQVYLVCCRFSLKRRKELLPG
jgi:hypothetical protein